MKPHPHLRGVVCHTNGMIEITHLKPHRGQVSTLTEGHIVKGYRKVCHRQQSGDPQKLHSVHRLIAETFIPNPDNKPEVNHIDGDKLNNHVNNLECVTSSENSPHRVHTLGHTPSRHKCRVSEFMIMSTGETFTHDNIRTVADIFGVNYGSLKNTKRTHTTRLPIKLCDS